MIFAHATGDINLIYKDRLLGVGGGDKRTAQSPRRPGKREYMVTTLEDITDIEGALKLVTNAIKSNRTKHVDVIYHFIRGVIQENKIYSIHTDTEEQHADGMTERLKSMQLNGRTKAWRSENITLKRAVRADVFRQHALLVHRENWTRNKSYHWKTTRLPCGLRQVQKH